jgi:hypothetical protein
MAQHSAKGARFQAVTANRLTDGEVVYSPPTMQWAENFSGEVVEGAEAADALFARATPADFESRVLGAYLFEVLEDGAAGYKPASVRENIRAKGPTIRLDLGKQAAI